MKNLIAGLARRLFLLAYLEEVYQTISTVFEAAASSRTSVESRGHVLCIQGLNIIYHEYYVQLIAHDQHSMYMFRPCFNLLLLPFTLWLGLCSKAGGQAVVLLVQEKAMTLTKLLMQYLLLLLFSSFFFWQIRTYTLDRSPYHCGQMCFNFASYHFLCTVFFYLHLVFLIECEEKVDEFLQILQFFLTKVLASFYHDVPCVALRKLSHDRIRGCFVCIIAKMYSVFHFKLPFCKYPFANWTDCDI